MSAAPTVILCGYGQFGCAAFTALRQAGFHISLVITHQDHPQENCWWQSLAMMAQEANIAVVIDPDLSADSEHSRLISNISPDLLFSAFFRDLIGRHLLTIPRLGAWNMHPSLLPAYRGRAAINWQLVHGESRSGLTVHRMVARADAGVIIAQESVLVDQNQDAYGLTWQLLNIAPRVLAHALACIVRGESGLEQDLTHGSIFGRRRPADGLINWQLSAIHIHNLVRAVAPPWPGAFTTFSGQSLLISRTRVLSEGGHIAAPGTILSGNRIACGAGVISIICAFQSAHQIGHLPVGQLLTDNN
jgi:methionyl-tRNA formyltransferase